MSTELGSSERVTDGVDENRKWGVSNDGASGSRAFSGTAPDSVGTSTVAPCVVLCAGVFMAVESWRWLKPGAVCGANSRDGSVLDPSGVESGADRPGMRGSSDMEALGREQLLSYTF